MAVATAAAVVMHLAAGAAASAVVAAAVLVADLAVEALAAVVVLVVAEASAADSAAGVSMAEATAGAPSTAAPAACMAEADMVTAGVTDTDMAAVTDTDMATAIMVGTDSMGEATMEDSTAASTPDFTASASTIRGGMVPAMGIRTITVTHIVTAIHTLIRIIPTATAMDTGMDPHRSWRP